LNWLRTLAKHHKEWVEVAKTLGADHYAEDVVQEAYLKLVHYNQPQKFINDKNEIHRGYMFFVIRSVVSDFRRIKNKIKKVPIKTIIKWAETNDDLNVLTVNDMTRLSSFTNHDEEEAFWKLCAKMDKELENWSWYDKKIFEIYRDTPLSIRGMAKETDISWVNIFHTLKRGKIKMKEKFKEDYEDFKNKDYDLL
tara:strand:- start:393 stop:977 length:585 start_codon:yes stop_codon:yes gene_type:complete